MKIFIITQKDTYAYEGYSTKIIKCFKDEVEAKKELEILEKNLRDEAALKGFMGGAVGEWYEIEEAVLV